MDIATIAGIIAGIVLIASAIGKNMHIFLSMQSIMIVGGGTLAATLINFPLSDVLGVISTAKYAFFHKAKPPTDTISILVNFATIARKEGILALESHAAEANDTFMEKGIQLAIDGTSPELIKDILTTELAFLEDRHSLGQGVFTSMGTFAPAFGMIGTLIGLIIMLKNLENPSEIGGGMAVALITTFYGALAANLLFLPIAGKLRVRSQSEILTKEVIIEGILSIQSGDNPRIVEQKLKAFIPPSMRQSVKIQRI